MTPSPGYTENAPRPPVDAGTTLDPVRVRLLIPFVFLFGALSAWHHVMGDAAFSSIHPVSVTIHGLTDSDRDQVRVTCRRNYEDPELAYPNSQKAETMALRVSDFAWTIPIRGVEALHITAAPDSVQRIRAVDVRIGSRTSRFDEGSFRQHWYRIPALSGVLDGYEGNALTLEWRNGESGDAVINLQDKTELLLAVSRRALAVIGVAWCCCIGLIVFMRRCLPLRLPAPQPHTERMAVWLAIGFVVFFVGLMIARSRQPYAFTQDDSFSQFLPVILRSSESLLRGQFPVWNPYQLMGSPTATVGTYMLTYPPTYLSYGIARWIGGDPYLTIEVFVILHLAAGYFASFFVLRKFGLRPSLSAAGALSFILSAWMLISGRSQCTFVPAAVWLPLLALMINSLAGTLSGWKWSLAAGAILGAYYHAGHAQMWAYAVMFFVLAVALLAAGGRIAVSRALWAIPALCYAAAVAAPLLILQMEELHGRTLGNGGGGASLLGILVPLGRWAPDIRLLCTEPEWSGQISYSGSTFALAALSGAAFYFYRIALCRSNWQESRKLIGQSVWLILAVFALAMALGPDGVVWPLLSSVPPFDRFRWPTKLLPFATLFFCIGGGIVLERCFPYGRPRTRYLVVFATMGLILLNTFWARASWYTFADRPYPALDPEVAKRIVSRNGDSSGRLLTRFRWYVRSPAEGLFRAQVLNFPSVTGALAVGGYDTFIEQSPQNASALRKLTGDPAAAARAYGVRWVLWDKLFQDPVFSSNPAVNDFEALNPIERRILLGLRRRSSPAVITDVQELGRFSDPDPLAFVAVPEKRALPVRFDMTGAHTQVAGVPGNTAVVVNVLWRPWMKAFADGQPVSSSADEWGRVAVLLNSPAKMVNVLYCPPWGRSCVMGLVIALAGTLFGMILTMKTANRNPGDAAPIAV